MSWNSSNVSLEIVRKNIDCKYRLNKISYVVDRMDSIIEIKIEKEKDMLIKSTTLSGRINITV